MEQYIQKVVNKPKTDPNARYQCRKCNKYFSDKTKINNHLKIKKPCDVELAKLAKIAEYNISDIPNQFKCKLCFYEFKRRTDFDKHINKSTSCVEKIINLSGKEIRIKDGKEHLIERKENRVLHHLICKECFQDGDIRRAKGGKCPQHGGKQYEYKKCVQDDCKENGKKNMDGYCLFHYKLLDKDNKIRECPKCKKILCDNRALNRHIKRNNCLEKIEESKKYDMYRKNVDGYTRYKCQLCDDTFELDKFKIHQNMKRSCKEIKEIRETTSKYKSSDNGMTVYRCDKCDKEYTIARHMYIHLKNNCNKNDHIIKIINGKTIVFKGDNKFVRTIHNGMTNDNKCCKYTDCYIVNIADDYCKFHGGDLSKNNKYCLYNKCPNIRRIKGFCKKHYNQLSEDKINEIRKLSGEFETDKFLSCIKKIVSTCKHNDNRRNFNINIDDYISPKYILQLYEECNGNCSSCNRKVKCNFGNKSVDQFSIDRIDNSKSHIKDNIRITCLFCNRARNMSSLEEWNLYIKSLTGSKNCEKKGDINNRWIKETLSRCKSSKVANTIGFNLTEEWVKEQFNKNKYSYYSGIEMYPSKIPFYPFQPSIERIDNSKGYTMDNCVLCCLAENLGRNDMDHDDFKEWLNINFPKKVDNIVKIKIKKSSPIKVI